MENKYFDQEKIAFETQQKMVKYLKRLKDPKYDITPFEIYSLLAIKDAIERTLKATKEEDKE